MSKSHFFMFVTGVAVGAGVSWLCVKKYYEHIAQQEIDSVKEVFSTRKAKTSQVDPEQQDFQKPAADKSRNAEILTETPPDNTYAESYVQYHSHNKKKVEKKLDQPYVISPDEFGVDFSYDQINLTYYADGVLADDTDDEVKDIAGTVGLNFKDYFGIYEDDACYIRNDRLKAEYEILKDNQTYEDVMKTYGDFGG